jgi:amino acid adenylation domain-containing protein
MHHVISDGWSLGLFFQELDALYTAFLHGLASPLAELPIQYGDYAVWQRHRLSGHVHEEQVAFWKLQLEGAPVLQLPTDRPRPLAQSFRGASERFSIPPGVCESLRALSREQDATLFMILLAAFTVILHRYSEQDDVLVGLPVAGRTHRLVEGMIGFFINSLVLRTDLSGDPTFLELVARVRETTLSAFEHQDLPFEKLVEELHVPRDLGRNPLFQVTFQLINAPTLASGNGRAAAARPAPVPEVERGTAMFDLAFDLIEAPEGLLGRVEYSTDLFEAATVAGMAHSFEAVLSEVVRDPERPLSELLTSTPDERRRMEEWNATTVSWDGPQLLHELVAEQAARTPEAVAVVSGDNDTLSYRDLVALARQLARVLRDKGVKPGSLVGVCMERSLELVVALLGVLEAGAAYVPLDPSYPQARLSVMAEGVTVVVAHPHVAPLLAGTGASVVPLDGTWSLLRGRRRSRPASAIAPDDLAYMIYTSGSTGTPKGVMITHRAACNHMRWMGDAYPLSAADRVLQRTPISFDASVWEFFAPLLSGARLVLVPNGGHGDPALLVEAIRRHEVTVLQLVPSLLRLLLDEPGVSECTSLTRVFSGGEPLMPALRDWFAKTLPATLVNLYGPTEATIDALAWTCGRDEEGLSVPIGRPVANCRAHVLDHRLEPVPPGFPGELYLGGDVLARGYLRRPGLTSQRFVPDPFGAPGGRLYRTGDRVRQAADGRLLYLGRVDRQLKLRGVRIEPGEVEELLRRHDAVRDAAVVVREDVPGDLRLAAYVLVENQSATGEELRAHLASRLPEALVPSYVTVVERFELTPNGKLDYQGLPDPRTSASRSSNLVAPSTALESLLAALWGDVLHVDDVGVEDGFFNELGGHSLLATQLLSRVRDVLDVDIPLQRIFEAPTVASFAASLAQDEATQAQLERTAQLVLLIHSLSESEVDAMLATSEPGP